MVLSNIKRNVIEKNGIKYKTLCQHSWDRNWDTVMNPLHSNKVG